MGFLVNGHFLCAIDDILTAAYSILQEMAFPRKPLWCFQDGIKGYLPTKYSYQNVVIGFILRVCMQGTSCNGEQVILKCENI